MHAIGAPITCIIPVPWSTLNANQCSSIALVIWAKYLKRIMAMPNKVVHE